MSDSVCERVTHKVLRRLTIMDILLNQFPTVDPTLKLHFSPKEAVVGKKDLMAERVNFTGGEILELCNGKYRVEEIVKIMASRYKEEEEKARLLIVDFLKEAESKGYIEFMPAQQFRENYITGEKEVYIPRTIVLETTKRCNLRCKHCYVNAGENIKEWELDVHEWKKIVEDFTRSGTRYGFITGGEVFVVPEIMTLLLLCSERFDSIVIATNGYDIPLDYIDELSMFKNISFQISLDGGKETHNYIRGKDDAFQRAIENIYRLSTKKCFVTVAMVLIPLNVEEIEQVVKISKENGAKEFRAGWTFYLGRAVDKDWVFSEEKIEEISDNIKKLADKYQDDNFFMVEDVGKGVESESFSPDEKNKNCGAGSDSWSILSDGRVVPCLPIPILLGNLRQNSIAEIGSSDRVKLLSEIYSPCKKICGDCKRLFMCEGCFVEGYIGLKNLRKCAWSEQILHLLEEI